MAGRMTGSDVVTSSVTATGDMTTKRSRLRGFVVSGGSSDGTVTFKNTSSGATLLVLPVNADTTETLNICLLYTSPSPRDGLLSRMPSSA